MGTVYIRQDTGMIDASNVELFSYNLHTAGIYAQLSGSASRSVLQELIADLSDERPESLTSEEWNAALRGFLRDSMYALAAELGRAKKLAKKTKHPMLVSHHGGTLWITNDLATKEDVSSSIYRKGPALTLETAATHLGAEVRYEPKPGAEECGVIDSVNDSYVMVRYGTDSRPIATEPHLLSFLPQRDDEAADSDAAAAEPTADLVIHTTKVDAS